MREPVQAHKALMHAWTHAKAWLMAGHRLVLEVRPETRRDGHNRHFHSLIGQISRQLGGQLADAEDAKRILISAFKIDTRNDPDLAEDWAKFGEVRMGHGLRGEVVLMGVQSRDFTIKLARAFIEWLYAFGVEQGVQFKAWEGDQ
ncbi:recombination protein NinB [Acidovorax sp. Leaf160]|uniref:recombination protein NinB n=1 Tax=Acidovorax sp. Leaf160 TaxID=1736280 RepID=UPI001F262646|nr:recombination protein NinB [Acidovorax sp. Leaf160]